MQPHVPRIVQLLSAVALLVWVNREAPRILPAILSLVVLYVALTNLQRAEELVGIAEDGLGRLIHPSTPPRASGAGTRRVS